MFSYYHKISFNYGGSNINYLILLKIKKATINTINKKDNKCFLYAVTVALNYEEIKKDSRIITKIKPFINRYNWEGINFPSEKDDWKIFEKNNVTIVLNFLHAKKEKLYPAYVSVHNSNREKQVILLMIWNAEKWQYLAVKKTISTILRNYIKKSFFFVWIVFVHLEQKPNLNRIKESLKIKMFVAL